MTQLTRRLQISVAATLLATQLMACTSWHMVAPSDLAPTGPRPAQRVRVTLPDSSLVVWNNSVTIGGRIGEAPDARRGVQLTEVRRMEVQRFSLVKTTLLAGLIAGAVKLMSSIRVAGPGGCCGVDFAGPW